MTAAGTARTRRLHTLLTFALAAAVLGLIWWHAAASIQQMRQRALNGWAARQADFIELVAAEAESDFTAGLEQGQSQERLTAIFLHKLRQLRPLEGLGRLFVWSRQGPVFDSRFDRLHHKDLGHLLSQQSTHGGQNLGMLLQAVAEGGRGRGSYQWLPSTGPERVNWESIRLPGTVWTLFVATPEHAVLEATQAQGRVRGTVLVSSLASLLTLGAALAVHLLLRRVDHSQRKVLGAQAAMRSLADQRARLAALFESLPVPHAVLDQGGRVLKANRAFRQTVPMPHHAGPPGRHLVELPGFEAEAAAILAAMASGLAGPASPLEISLASALGQQRRYAVLLRPCPGPRPGQDQGNALADLPLASMTLTDITEQRQLEALLEESRALLEHRVMERTEDLSRAARKVEDSRRRLQALLDNMPDIAWLKDVSGRYISVNVPFARSIGLTSPSEIAGRLDQALLSPEEALFTREVDLTVIGTRQRHRVEQPYNVPGLGSRWHEVIRTPIFDETGLVIGVVGIARDMTERRQMLEELKDSEAELRRLNELLLSTQEEERTRIRQELHDSVGQLLTGIKWAVERAKLALGKGKAAQKAQTALADVVPLVQSTEEELSRILLALRPKALDELGLEAAVQSMCREFALGNPGVRMVTRIGLDESLLEPEVRTAAFRILQEALNNAGRHSRATKVVVRLGIREGLLGLTVGDNGQGFDATAPSPGLGLHNFQSRVRYAGGTCVVLTRPGCGTILRAKLPTTARPA